MNYAAIQSALSTEKSMYKDYKVETCWACLGKGKMLMRLGWCAVSIREAVRNETVNKQKLRRALDGHCED